MTSPPDLTRPKEVPAAPYVVLVVGGVYPRASVTFVLVIPIVILSLVASGVSVTLLPANVRVSVFESAATVVLPV